jgi:hypothetical protein
MMHRDEDLPETVSNNGNRRSEDAILGEAALKSRQTEGYRDRDCSDG